MASAAPNEVPERLGITGNYWCPWYAQYCWPERDGEIADFDAIDNPNAREELSY